jgi:hypothetical protein
MENLKETVANFKAKNEEYVKMGTTIRNAAERLIRELIEQEGGEINHRDNDLLDGIYVSYDGGRHPEYASCVACEVMRIYIKDDQIILDLEDAPEYNLDRVPTQEVVWMCDDLINNIKDYDTERI